MSKYILDDETILQDEKLEIMQHLNEDHKNDLLLMAQHFSDFSQIQAARVISLADENYCELQVDLPDQKQEIIQIKYTADGDITERLMFLIYEAMIKQKKMVFDLKTQYFEFISKEKIAKNFIRLCLRSYVPLAENYAALAYNFKMQNLKDTSKTKTLSSETSDKSGKMSFLQHKFFSATLFILKRLSSQKRTSILKQIAGGKYYTVRKIAKSNPQQDFYDLTYVDVFTHGKSPGSIWANSIKKPEIAVSINEHPDAFLSLKSNGKALLIGDEAAFPAIAGFLENWQSNLAPSLLLIAGHKEDETYFADCNMPENTQIHWLFSKLESQVDDILPKIDAIWQSEIDLVWGALEANVAKKVRVFVRKNKGISNANSVIKGYWIKS